MKKEKEESLNSIEKEIEEHNRKMMSSKIADDNHSELLARYNFLRGKLEGFRKAKKQEAEKVEKLKEELDDSLIHIKREAPIVFYQMEGYVQDVKEVIDKIFGRKLI